MTAAEAPEPLVITKPGVYEDIPHDVYLADPVLGGSLSHSGAKTLVTKTAALFAYEREHGRPDKRAYDLGHAAHQAVLGVGPGIVKIDAGDWRSKAAKEAAAEVRASGGVPLLPADFDTAIAMSEAIKVHPVAAKLLEPGSGRPEVSAFTVDPDTGVWLRCRYDWLRSAPQSGRLLLVDYKTARSAEKDAFAKSAVDYGYDVQDAWYSEIARLLNLADDVAFLFIVQEVSPPYLVNVIQLDITARRIGAIKRRAAINTYRRCTETGTWPGYGDDVQLASLPFWHERLYETELAS